MAKGRGRTATVDLFSTESLEEKCEFWSLGHSTFWFFLVWCSFKIFQQHCSCTPNVCSRSASAQSWPRQAWTHRGRLDIGACQKAATVACAESTWVQDEVAASSQKCWVDLCKDTKLGMRYVFNVENSCILLKVRKSEVNCRMLIKTYQIIQEDQIQWYSMPRV